MIAAANLFMWVLGGIAFITLLQGEVVSALGFGGIACVGYMVADSRRKAHIKAQQDEEARRLQQERDRIQAIVNHPETYLSLTSESGLTDVETARRSGNIEQWATSLQTRYDRFKTAIENAKILVDHRSAEFQQFRTDMLREYHAPYREMIRPFTASLHEAETRGRLKQLEPTDNFAFPATATKEAYHASIASARRPAMTAINHFTHKHTHTQGDWLTLAVGLAISYAMQKKRESEARVKLEEAQGEVEDYVRDATGNLKAVKGYTDYLALKRKEIEQTAQRVRTRMNALREPCAKATASSHGDIANLEPHLQKEVMMLYMDGENLGRVLTAEMS